MFTSTRWVKFVTVALAAVFIVGLFGAVAPAHAQGDGANARRPKVLRQLLKTVEQAVETETSLTKEQIRTQIREGKSLAEIVTAAGKSVDAVKTAAKATLTAEIDQAVTDGKLTQARADKFKENLDSAIDRVLNAKRSARRTPAVATPEATPAQ